MTATVIHLIESLGRGGAETALVAGLPALRPLGWKVEVVALHPPGDLASQLQERGVSVSFGLPQLARRLLASRAGPHLVHTHLFFANMWGRVAGALARVPVVTTLHNADYGTQGTGRFGARRVLDGGLLSLKRPTFASVSESVRADYAEHLGVSSVICANPIDEFWLAPPPSRAEARARLGLGGDARPLLFACGRLTAQKGFDLLARVARQLPDVRVVIAGGGPDGDIIRGHGPVELVGLQSQMQLRDWIRASDLVVAPSRYEAFGIFALEAMALGAAIVASDIPGLRDTLGGCGRLVPADDQAALLAAVQQLLGDGETRARLGAAAAARAPAFSAGAWAVRYDEMYRSLLGLPPHAASA